MSSIVQAVASMIEPVEMKRRVYYLLDQVSRFIESVSIMEFHHDEKLCYACFLLEVELCECCILQKKETMKS